MIPVVVDTNTKAPQGLESTFESTHAMLRSNMQVRNSSIKSRIFWAERCRFLVDQNCPTGDRVCRVYPGKLLTIKEPVWVLSSCSVLKSQGYRKVVVCTGKV